MKRFRDPVSSPGQQMLLPPCVDDFVEEDAPVRLLSEIVDKLDVGALRDLYAGGGAPAYDPVMMAKCLVFGMSQGVRSSRQLERACRYDTRFMFLMCMAKPDYRTIARFRRAMAPALEKLFRSSVRAARRMGLVLLEHGSVDGSKVEAAGSRRGYHRREALERELARMDAEIQRLQSEWDANDQREDALYGGSSGEEVPEELRGKQARKAMLEQIKEQMTFSGESSVVSTDPDSHMMKTSSGLRPAYNAEVVVDECAHLVLAVDVHQSASDAHALGPMMEQTRQTLGELPHKVSADGGFWSNETLTYVEEQQLDAYVAPAGEKQDTMEGWTYDEASDTCVSPEGRVYRFSGVRQNHGRRYRVYRDPKTRKQKWIAQNRDQMLRMRAKVRSAQGRAIYGLRKTTVEPVFGHLKVAYGLRRLLLRGLSGARVECTLACLTHNIGKMICAWPAPGA